MTRAVHFCRKNIFFHLEIRCWQVKIQTTKSDSQTLALDKFYCGCTYLKPANFEPFDVVLDWMFAPTNSATISVARHFGNVNGVDESNNFLNQNVENFRQTLSSDGGNDTWLLVGTNYQRSIVDAGGEQHAAGKAAGNEASQKRCSLLAAAIECQI